MSESDSHDFTGDDYNRVLISATVVGLKTINLHSGGACLLEASALLTF